VCNLSADARRSRTTIRQEGRRSTIVALKYFPVWRVSHFSQFIHLPRSWRLRKQQS
jgi:hypothetical protein